MTILRFVPLVGLAALLIAPASAAARQDADSGQDDFADSMLGTYAIERGQRGDERLSGDELEGTVRITRDRISLHRADGGELYAARYLVDEVFDGTAKLTLETVKVKSSEEEELQTESEDTVGTEGKALVTLNEDEGFLTIIYDVEGDEYPDDFTPDRDEQHLFVLKKKADIEK